MARTANSRLMLVILAAVFAFLYVPISVLVALSFNDGGLPTAWTGFSVKWYGELFRNADVMSAAFNTLVTNLDACVAAGRSASTDTFVDAVSIWTSLHGQVMLRADLPEFPWPSTDTVGEMVRSLARLVN